jgi:DNA-binding NarL/FixJ family response regulator
MTQSTDQEQQSISTVVVSRPGIMQQSLRAALESFHVITLVALCGDGLTALRKIEHLQPGMLVIDSNLLAEEVKSLIEAAKIEQPGIRCLAFIRSIKEKKQVLISGADAVVLRDSPPRELQSTLVQLVQEIYNHQ